MTEIEAEVTAQALQAATAARTIATVPTEERNRVLLSMADALAIHEETILSANARDVAMARERGQSSVRLDRLALTPARLAAMREGLAQVATLADPVGQCIEERVLPNGLKLRKIRVPIGLIAMVYESRPNVTVDAAGLAIKTGNAAILRGGSEAIHSNRAIADALCTALRQHQLPEAAVTLVQRTERESVDVLLRAQGVVDLIIPRGGAGLISHVVSEAKVPVIETGVGTCHVYVDIAANQQMARDIVINAKVSRPSVCNAIETVLVHADAAEEMLPAMLRDLHAHGVTLRVCPWSREIIERTSPDLVRVIQDATAEDWETEYLDLCVAVRTVSSAEDAIAHITRYGTKHSEAIVTDDAETAAHFLTHVDAAVVYHNASTRFTDGFEFGFGAEIGISTQKIHARGPMGLEALTSYKYTVVGTGQIRS